MERTLELHGHTVHLREEGTGDTVLLLHNGGTSHTIWRHQIADLARTHHVLALDLPGYGASRVGPGGIDLPGHAKVVAGVLERYGRGRVTLVGNCMGAAIALHLAAARPQAVAGVVLVNPLTSRTFDAGALGAMQRLVARRPRVAGGLRWLAARVCTPASLGPAVVRLQLGPRGRAARLHHDPELLALGRRPQQLPALLETLVDLPCSYGLEGLELPEDLPPVHVVWGEDNHVLDPQAALALHRRLDVDAPVLLPGCGHLAMLEDAPAVTDAIRRALPPTDAGPATTAEGAQVPLDPHVRTHLEAAK